MTNDAEAEQIVFDLARSPIKIIHSQTPLYSAMAASSECIIYYENRRLSVNGRKSDIRKSIEWKNNCGHVIDICWYKDSKFIILTKQELYLFNVDNETFRLLNRLSEADKTSTYYRCTSDGTRLMLCYWQRGTTIEEWNLQQRVKEWNSPKSCKQDEFICCLRLSSESLAVTVVNSMKESRFELREPKKMSILHSINLTQLCYRFISTHDNKWLLVPYYRGRRHVVLIDGTRETVEEIQIPSYYVDDNNDELIWNVAMMPGNNSCLVFRYENAISFFNIE